MCKYKSLFRLREATDITILELETPHLYFLHQMLIKIRMMLIYGDLLKVMIISMKHSINF